VQFISVQCQFLSAHFKVKVKFHSSYLETCIFILSRRNNLNKTQTFKEQNDMQRLSSRPENTNSLAAPATMLGCVSQACNSKSQISSGSHSSLRASNWRREEDNQYNCHVCITRPMLKSPYKLKPLLKVLIHPRKNKN
jgi:hypothetical protein